MQQVIKIEPLSGSTVDAALSMTSTARRIISKDWFAQSREIEIDHEGRIYRLRITQNNKLILTA